MQQSRRDELQRQKAQLLRQIASIEEELAKGDDQEQSNSAAVSDASSTKETPAPWNPIDPVPEPPKRTQGG